MYGLEALIPLFVLGVVLIVIAAPIAALVKAFSVGQQLESLRKEVARLSAMLRERPGEAGQAQPSQQPQAPPTQAAPQASPPRAPEGLPVTQPRESMLEQLHTAAQLPPAPTPAPPPVQRFDSRTPPVSGTTPAPHSRPAPAPSRTIAEWEMLIGGNVVNRIAALGLIIVAAFFLKYAYDQHWIKPSLIVLIGFVTGLALLYGGSRFYRAGAQVFAQGLLGAGISILYLSGYATFRYELVGQPIALGIMSIVTAISIVQALRYHSLVVCLLGLAGGFLTPLLLGGGSGHGSVNHFGLFAYIVLLDVGLLAVALKKDSWAIIEPLALAATYITYLVWANQYFTRPLFSTALPFVAVVWLVFCSTDLCRIARSISTFSALRAVVGVCNSLFFYIAIYYLMNSQFGSHPAEFKRWMALVSVMIGSVYFISMLALLRSRPEDRTFAARYALTAISLLVIATAIQYAGFPRITLWSIEAAGLIWCGLKWSSRSTTWSGIPVFGISVVALIAQDGTFACGPIGTFVPVWNPRFLAFAALAAALGLSGYLFRRSDVDDRDPIGDVFESAWSLLVLVLLAVEINDYLRKLMYLHPSGSIHGVYDYSRCMAIGGVWGIYATALTAYGLARKSAILPYLGLGALALGTIVVAGGSLNTASTNTFLPVLNVRALGFAVIFVVLLVEQYLFARYADEDRWTGALFGVFRVAICVLAFELVTAETSMLFSSPAFAKSISALGVNTDLLSYLALGAAWVIYSLPVVWFGLRERSQVLAVIGLCALGAGVGFIAAQGFTFHPIEHFKLIANVRFAAFAIAAAGLLIHYGMFARRREEFEWTGGVLGVLQVAISLLIFELVTAETSDFFTRMAAVGIPAKVIIYSVNMRQMTLSVVWLIYSFLLISFGFLTRMRTIRFVAIALFAIAILKVFLSDLSFLEPLYRIFSFLGLALILFATSYLYQRYRNVILDVEDA